MADQRPPSYDREVVDLLRQLASDVRIMRLLLVASALAAVVAVLVLFRNA